MLQRRRSGGKLGWRPIVPGIYRSIRGFAPEVVFVVIRQVGRDPERTRSWMRLRLMVGRLRRTHGDRKGPVSWKATASEGRLVVSPWLVLEGQMVMFEVRLERRVRIEVRRVVMHHLVPLNQGQHLGGFLGESLQV